MIPITILIRRATHRTTTIGDYWYRAAEFLRKVRRIGKANLTVRERAWLSLLRQELAEPGDG